MVKSIIQKIENNYSYSLIPIILVGVTSFLINLDVLPTINDEIIRLTVALEIKLSNNYIVPTIDGEYYYNKPPLYNWVLLFFSNFLGGLSIWGSRFTTIIFISIYSISIYYYAQKHFTKHQSLLITLMFLTCGRILFWDSLVGLIDVCFSWVVFLQFMAVYNNYKKGGYWNIFLITYFLTFIGFMLKGLPAIVFQGFSLVSYFLYKKDLKGFFSIQHILSGLSCLLLIGGYYFLYSQYNNLDTILYRLFDESAKRTVIEEKTGAFDFILHGLVFPFEMSYHFAPWGFLLIYLFDKQIITRIKSNKYIVACSVLFLANIIVYWSSPHIYPRYLFMFAPLIFTVFAYLHFEHEKNNTIHYKIVTSILTTGVVASVFLLLSMIIGTILIDPSVYISGKIPDVIGHLPKIKFYSLKTFILFICVSTTAFLFFKTKKTKWLHLCMLMFFLKIGFNWIAVDLRDFGPMGEESRLKKTIAHEIVELTGDKPLFLFKKDQISIATSFHLKNERQFILKHKDKLNKGSYYLMSKKNYTEHQKKLELIKEFIGVDDSREKCLVLVN